MPVSPVDRAFEFIGDRYKDLLKKRPRKIAPSRETTGADDQMDVADVHSPVLARLATTARRMIPGRHLTAEPINDLL